MKKIVVLLLMVATGIGASAQRSKIEDALRQMDKNPPDYELALEYIKEAKENPETSNDSKTYRAMGEIYIAIAGSKDEELKAKYPDAFLHGIDAYIRCMELNTSKFEYKTAAQYLFEEGGITFAYTFGTTAYKNEEFDKAVKYFELIIRAIPFDERGALERAELTIDYMHLLTAQAAQVGKMYDKALMHYNKVLEHNSKDQDAYIAISQIHLDKGDTTAAFETVKKGREVMPDSLDLREREIGLYQVTGRIGELEAKVNEALKTDPNNALLYSLRGDIFDSKGDNESAIADYKKAIELDPDNSIKAHNNLGAQYLKIAAPLVEEYNTNPGFDRELELEEQIQGLYKKAIPHFEYVADNSEDISIRYEALKTLRDLYKDTKNQEKYLEVDKEIKELEASFE